MGFQRQGKQHLGFHNLAMKPEDLAVHLGLHRCSKFNLLIIFILGAHSLASLVNASTGTEAMFLLPVESEHIERRQEFRFICTHPSEHGTCKTVLVDTSGISLLKLNYEFTCCIISILTPFVCLLVYSVHCGWEQSEITHVSCFSFSTTWVLGIKFRSSDFATSVLTW